MFLTSVVLSVGLTTVFAEPFFPIVNQANPNFVPQQVPSMTREDQPFSSNMPLPPMEGNQNMYPIPQIRMMQGYQPPFPFNPINQQQLSLLLMSTYARMISLIQLMNMQHRYQPYNQYNDPAVNNFVQPPVPLPYVQPPVPLPYVQQPQEKTQENFQSDLLEQQQQQAEAQRNAILEQRKIQRKYDMEIQRREELINRQAEEEEIENKQKEIERQLLDEEEIENQRKEAQQQIFEEEQEEIRRKEEESRLQKIEDEKLKQNTGKKLRKNSQTKLVKKSRKP